MSTGKQDRQPSVKSLEDAINLVASFNTEALQKQINDDKDGAAITALNNFKRDLLASAARKADSLQRQIRHKSERGTPLIDFLSTLSTQSDV